jgi:hypothetical protein
MKPERIAELKREAEIALRRNPLVWAHGVMELIEEIDRKPSIPHEAVCFFKDGNMWCCVHGDFVNLQESPAGFGKTFEEALANLKTDSRLDHGDGCPCGKCEWGDTAWSRHGDKWTQGSAQGSPNSIKE